MYENTEDHNSQRQGYHREAQGRNRIPLKKRHVGRRCAVDGRRTTMRPRARNIRDRLEAIGFYLDVFIASLSDMAGSSAYPKVELCRDIEEIRHRASHEGIQFLTRTCPSYAKAVDTALASGAVLQVRGFQCRGRTPLPLFLGWWLAQIFDSFGCERSDASADALSKLRQTLYLFYKLELPIDTDQANDVINLFRDTDSRLPDKMPALDSTMSWIVSEAKNLIHRVLAPVDPLGIDFVPRHGPGSVATGEKCYEKPFFKRIYSRLEKSFPLADYFFFNYSHLCDRIQDLETYESRESGTAKVVLVPKDSRGPRLISCEPLELQWIQQGLMRSMVKAISRHPMTSSQVNFVDQTINRRLALEGSLGRPVATLDMKEASDRVSLCLVERLFPRTWFDALYACRSSATRLPSGEVVMLKKFAPMGSAVCFPVESLVFWALSVAVIMNTNPDISRWNACSQVFVFGDDLIVPLKDQEKVRHHLPKLDLLFNDGKCCVAGSFRESCGCDAYKGIDVTPLRIKCTWDPHLAGMAYPSWVSYHNEACRRGLFGLADLIAGAIQRVKRTPYSSTEECSCVCLVDDRKMARVENIKLNIPRRRSPVNGRNDYQRNEFYATQVRARIVNTGTSCWEEMLRTTTSSVLAPDGCGSEMSRINPTRVNFRQFLGEAPLVTACQYALPRQAILRRGWYPIDVS